MTRRTLRKNPRDAHKRKSLWFALLALVSCHDDQQASSGEARSAHHSVRLIDLGTSKIAAIKVGSRVQCVFDGDLRAHGTKEILILAPAKAKK